jgi:hypothetical protein
MPSEKVLSAAFCSAHGLAGHITAISLLLGVLISYGIAAGGDGGQPKPNMLEF